MFLIRDYVSIARPRHWIKNFFMLLGAVLAFMAAPDLISAESFGLIAVGFVSICLLSSANYVLNEILDAATDAEHPIKNKRPLAQKKLSLTGAYLLWLVLTFSGIGIASMVNPAFLIVAIIYWALALAYNVKPVRLKELPIIDVIIESANNPLRLLFGWFASMMVTLPPTSLILSFWFFGAFGMAAKRLAEYREINDHRRAALYRKSFHWYTEPRLVMTMVGYSSGFMFFFGVIVVKLRPEILFAVPLLIVLLSYIVKLTFEENSILQYPENLLLRPFFVLYGLFCLVMIIILYLVELPFIGQIFEIGKENWKLDTR